MAVGYQTFYTAQLTSAISDTELTIPLDIVPTPDEGFLVLESTITNKREVIYYTSKTINSVVCPSGGRGYDGTTAVSHLQGATVIMAPVGAMFDELRDQFTTSPQGWTSIVPAVSTVTHNGNRSYDVAFASSIASTLSDGMRLQFTKTVAGNGYMGGAFNGSSHYFTKASPSGTLGTVTNNFTIEAVVMPTSYADGTICARSDATPANNIALQMNASGQVYVNIRNGGAGNSRSITTYQSLSLNKKTHVAASWTSGTVVIYFDGVSVPVQAAVTGGTAPTVAGTGGDFSIGRLGAYAGSYFPGYISNVAVFDAVLSAATIRQHATIRNLGNEPNCIGAWPLDNSRWDATVSANHLTEMGGVGYTAQTPHGQLGNGVETTKSVGLVMNVSGSTATVQVPEGCTIPTTGGITSVAYSTQANPFGWVSDKGRWEVASHLRTSSSTTSNASFGSFISGGWKLNVPTGSWQVGIMSGFTNSTTTTVVFCISKTALTGLTEPQGNDISPYSISVRPSAASITTFSANVTNFEKLSTATDFVMYTFGATTGAAVYGTGTKCAISATPAGL